MYSGKPAAGSAKRVQHARGVLAELGVDGDGIALASDSRRRKFGHPRGRRVEPPAGVRRLDPILGMQASQMPAPSG